MDFLQNVTLKFLKLKPDKWQKLLASEENRTVVGNFFEKAEFGCLVLSLNSASQLTASLEFPQTNKNKAVCFLKKGKEVINKDNIQYLSVGDVAPSPVEATVGLIEKVSLKSSASQFN